MTGRLLAITGGHRFDEPAMTAMLDDVCRQLGWQHTHATQPSAQRWLRPEHAGEWDAILLHDIPGLVLARGSEPEQVPPTDDVRRAVLELLDLGQGIVATHHSLAGWPAWDEWADVLGGRFLYAPSRLHGEQLPASGYRMARYRVELASADHPVCEGIEPFELDDELYLCPVFEDRVTPLLTTPADRSPEAMIDTYREVRHGERVPAVRQSGSRLVGWTSLYGASRIVYVLPGHGPGTMAHEQYRRLIANACRWVAESTAREPIRR
jgi:type 1 glutamine amidotransferase